MKIEYEREHLTEFCKVVEGDVFILKNMEYLKIHSIIIKEEMEEDDDEIINAINLQISKGAFIASSTKVDRVKTTLTIER